MKLRKLPIGLSDFKRIIEDDMFYADKSLLIQELIDSGTLVNLIVRPRRFGKTTNLFMLKYFFEKHPKLESTRHLFKNLQIEKEGEEYMKHCGKYPVIFLTFKDVKEKNWERSEAKLKLIISNEYERHNYLLSSPLISDKQKKMFEDILCRTADSSVLNGSLKLLTELLYSYHNERVMLLLDEYDTPIHEAYENGFYTDIISFIRSFLGSGLKDNSCLHKGVITGILRISKESIFSDINNLEVFTILDRRFSDKFGLTEKEVQKSLTYYGLDSCKEGVKNWYNGYSFGNNENIYNPWSILNFIDKNEEGLKPHWVNTSSNLLVKKLLTNAGTDAKKDLEMLLTGQSISKEIVIDTVFSEIEKNSETLWSFLLFCGYLKVTGQEIRDKRLFCNLQIPNLEVDYLFERFISSWLSDGLPSGELKIMLNSLIHGSLDSFAEPFQKYVMNSMSYFDPTGEEPEKVYHAFVLGLLLHLSDTHSVRSNRESGFGRYDIMLIPKNTSYHGVIIEFKKVSLYKEETLQSAAEAALKQIEEKQYEAELKALGVSVIHKYAVVFEGKETFVMMG